MLAKIGKQIIGWSTVVFILLLISGLTLWWPKHYAALKQRLWFKWKDTTQWKRKNYDLHNIPGFYSMLLALCIGLTGLWFAFEWFRGPVRWVANGGKAPVTEQPVLSDSLQMTKPGLLEQVYQQSKNQLPLAHSWIISIPEQEKKGGTLRVIAYHNPDNYVKRSMLFLDRYTGKMLRNKPYDKLTGAEKFTYMIYDIHVGRILGIPGMVLAFIASLIAAALPITGFYIWLGRKKKKRRATKEPVSQPIADTLTQNRLTGIWERIFRNSRRKNYQRQ